METELGLRRPPGSIMYITEVAVSPKTRRSGAGEMLLNGMNEIAKRKKVETIYLHVDVENDAAVALYKKVGYEILDSHNELYLQFTTKLNLHDGATRGRKHYLMSKNITKTQTWYPPIPRQETVKSVPSQQRGTLGFDVLKY
jgi:predicted acetyltransferase